MDKRLATLIQMVQETGDRLVVLPEGDGEPFVLMSVGQYRALRAGKQAQHAESSTAPAAQASQTSVLADNYNFEPVAYEEPPVQDVSG